QTEFGRTSQVVEQEEEAFRRTLASGTTILDTAVTKAKKAGVTTLTGDAAFQLHDTYGFPIDLTLEMAGEQGLAVDEGEFRRLMNEQRRRAKEDARAKKTGHADVGGYRAIADRLATPVVFTGYDEVVSEGRVAGLLVDGELADVATEGQAVEIVLDRTPFYAEGGGQLADAGRLEVDGAFVVVDDVQSPITGLITHRARVLSGELRTGELAQALVDVERRKAVSRSHTATHMVHKAIREALGETATQAGSENSPGRFRFDFHAGSALPMSVLRDVEARVNHLLVEDLEVHAEIMTQEQARAAGAMALFGEKYGDRVRVISVGDWARELCGGTHAARSGQLGLVTLLGEGSIGSGVRRVEALVGTDAYDFAAREHVLVSQLTDTLKVRPDELPERVANLVAQLRDAQKEIDRHRSAQVQQAAAQAAQTPRDVFGVNVVTRDAGESAPDDLRTFALDVRGRMPGERPAVVAVGGVVKGRPQLVVATNEEARRWGITAGDLVRAGAAVLGGNGGGKPDVAQGGGTEPQRIGDALQRIEHSVGELVTAGR
ncbi:MAG TPA: alanine--tRNA ligase-related protein, partial [Solirubrobacteraceae bacterium]